MRVGPKLPWRRPDARFAVSMLQRFNSIRFIIPTSFSLVIIAMMFVGGVLYHNVVKNAEENASLDMKQIVDQVGFNLEYYVNSMSGLFQQLDNKIRQSDDYRDERLDIQLKDLLGAREDIVSMALFTEDGQLLKSIPEQTMRGHSRLTEQSWFKSAQENPGHMSFSMPHIQNLFQRPYTWVVSMSQEVPVKINGRQQKAVLLLDVNFKTIDDLCRQVSLGKRGYVYLIDDSSGSIVYHRQQQLIYAGLKYENVEAVIKLTYGHYIDNSTGERRLITVSTVHNIGWKIVGVSYLSEITTSNQDVALFVLWPLIVGIVIMLLVSLYMSRKIAKPIRRLERSMEKVEQGNFDIDINVRGGVEIERLSHRFDLMVSRIRQLMQEIIHEQEAKRKNELEVLQAQINPHFLYNTLNSVVRMIGSGKNEEVITMITSLSRLFRISLSKGKNVITVQDELEHIRHYLTIQSFRYKNKIEYTIEAEEEALSCLTLKLLLQPLVENAIYHGIEKMADKGIIRIRAAIRDGKLLFTVEDNGLGMPESTVAKLFTDGVKSERSGGGSGVGIRNVQERIRLYYGNEYGLEVESELEEGTTIRVWIPVVRQGSEGGAETV